MDIKSGSYLEDPVTNNTYYTALDTVTASGKLFMVGVAMDISDASYQWVTNDSLNTGVTIKITLDDVATAYSHVVPSSGEAIFATVDGLAVDGGGNRHRFGRIMVNARFGTNIKIEVKQNTGVSQAVRVFWVYGQDQ
jgi:hypothetical protein